MNANDITTSPRPQRGDILKRPRVVWTDPLAPAFREARRHTR